MNPAELSMILMAVAAGAMMPIQAGVNSTLALQTHSSLMAAMDWDMNTSLYRA